MCRAIFAFFWGTVTLLLSGNHVIKDQIPILDLDEVYYQDNGLDNECLSCDTLSQRNCMVETDYFSKENEEQLINPVTTSNPGLVLTSTFSYKSTALSKAVTSPAMLSRCEIIALPIPTLDFTIYQPTTVFTSAVTIYEPTVLIPTLGLLTIIEPTTVSTSAITIYEPTVLYEDLSIPTLSIIEPTTDSTSAIIIYEPTVLDLSIPTLEPTTSAITIYEPTEDLSIPTLSIIDPTTDSTSAIIIYEPTEDLSIPTLGIIEPTTVSTSAVTIRFYEPTVLSAVFTSTIYDPTALTHDLASVSVYKVTAYTPNFLPGGSCPIDKVTEIGWFQYCVSKIYNVISFNKALWFFLFLAWCVCIKAIVRKHELFCKEKDSRLRRAVKFRKLNLQSEYRTRKSTKFIRLKEQEIELIKKQSIEKDNLLERKNALVEKYFQSHKKTEEKYMEKVAKLERHLEMMKNSQLEQETKFMQQKEELVRQQSIEKMEIKNALERIYYSLNGAEQPPWNGAEQPPWNGAEQPPWNGAEQPPWNGAVQHSGGDQGRSSSRSHLWKEGSFCSSNGDHNTSNMPPTESLTTPEQHQKHQIHQKPRLLITDTELYINYVAFNLLCVHVYVLFKFTSNSLNSMHNLWYGCMLQ